MPVFYYEYYPHDMGTMSAMIKLTKKEFDNLITLAKDSIKSKGDADLDDAIKALEKKNKVTLYALDNALTNFGESPRRPATINTAMNKKGLWADQWEEGSHAFASTERKAVKAVQAIEAKVSEECGEW